MDNQSVVLMLKAVIALKNTAGASPAAATFVGNIIFTYKYYIINIMLSIRVVVDDNFYMNEILNFL